MQIRQIQSVLLVLSFTLGWGFSAEAAGRVQLELVGESQGSAMAFQQWARVLGEAGIRNVRIRSAKATDEVRIEIRGSDESPVYLVTGIVRSQDELLLPGGRYSRRDVKRLAQWLDDLAEHGPTELRPPTGAFGLTAKQFEAIHQQLAATVDFSTQDVPRDKVVERIGHELGVPLQLDNQAIELLGTDKVAEELSGFSTGTVLAYVLRPMGLCLRPNPTVGNMGLVVVKSRPQLELWPVGWEPDKPRRDVLPALFEFHNINIQSVTADKAMAAIAKQLDTPILLDHNALARHGIDPSTIAVNHPRKRTTYSIALRKVLFQARLKSELRLDEAGRAFFWVTTVKQ